jgi:hypothetical protein
VVNRGSSYRRLGNDRHQAEAVTEFAEVRKLRAGFTSTRMLGILMYSTAIRAFGDQELGRGHLALLEIPLAMPPNRIVVSNQSICTRTCRWRSAARDLAID